MDIRQHAFSFVQVFQHHKSMLSVQLKTLRPSKHGKAFVLAESDLVYWFTSDSFVCLIIYWYLNNYMGSKVDALNYTNHFHYSPTDAVLTTRFFV